MLIEKYNIRDAEKIYSEVREILGKLRAIRQEAGYRLENKKYKEGRELQKLEAVFYTLDGHIYSMMEELDEL